MTDHIRVWVVSPEVHRHGGTERCLAEELERWRTRFSIRLYTQSAAEIDLDGIDLVRVPRLPGPHVVSWLHWLMANHWRRWRDAKRLGRPDVVFSPGVNCLDADVIAVHIVFNSYWDEVGRSTIRHLILGPQRLRSAHRLTWWSLLRVMERWVYSGPAQLWALSRRDSSAISQQSSRPLPRVIPNGVTIPDGVTGYRNNKGRLLIVGNDAVKKGVDTAISALANLPHARLTVVGRVDLDLVSRWAQSSGVSERVMTTGAVSDTAFYYADSDLLLHPSRNDAFPLPPLEAMAWGLPVVLSNRNGLAELVEDGRHALVLKNPEDPAELAAAVRRILEDPELAERLSREGRALAERCSWDANAEAAAALIAREATTPRVLVLATDVAEAGGVGRATRSLLAALVEAYGADRVGVLAVWGGPDPEVPGWILDPGRTGSGRVTPAHRAAFAARVVRTARRWRRRLVIVAAHPHLAPLARMAARVAGGAPYVVWNHGFESWAPRDRRVRAALQSADTLWAVSRHTAERMVAAGFAPERIRIIHHAVPTEVTAAAAAPAEVTVDGPVVLMVSRLDPEHRYKGVETLLAAWPGVRAAHPDAELVIIGDGPDRPALERMARSVGATGVRFTGRVTDAELAGWYRRAAVFALPARVEDGPAPGGEGFGLVFVEAMAAGLPVVAGDAGPAPEIVQDGRTGLLVDPRDPQAVAGAIAGLLDDPARAAAMGAAGRAVVAERFSPERFRRDVEAAIADLAPRWRRRR